MKTVFRMIRGKIRVFRVERRVAQGLSETQKKASQAIRRSLRSTASTKSSTKLNKDISGRISVNQEGLFQVREYRLYNKDKTINTIQNEVTRKLPSKYGKRGYSEDWVGQIDFQNGQNKLRGNSRWHSASSDIDEHYQRKGVATKVYDRFEKKNKVKLISGDTNGRSGNFWRKREHHKDQVKKWRKLRGHLKKGDLKGIKGMRNYKDWG